MLCMSGKNERRAEKRVPTKLEVHFESIEDAARVFKAYSLNLSPGGICIRSAHRHKPGELIRLSLSIDGKQFKIKARIAWVKEEVMGVRFEGLPLTEMLQIRALLWPTKTRKARPGQAPAPLADTTRSAAEGKREAPSTQLRGS